MLTFVGSDPIIRAPIASGVYAAMNAYSSLVGRYESLVCRSDRCIGVSGGSEATSDTERKTYARFLDGNRSVLYSVEVRGGRLKGRKRNENP